MRDYFNCCLCWTCEVSIHYGRAANPGYDATLLGEVGQIKPVMVDSHVLQYLHGHTAIVFVVKARGENGHQRKGGWGAHGNPKEHAWPANPSSHFIHYSGFSQSQKHLRRG